MLLLLLLKCHFLRKGRDARWEGGVGLWTPKEKEEEEEASNGEPSRTSIQELWHLANDCLHSVRPAEVRR